MGVDADLGVEVEAVETSLAASGQVDLAALRLEAVGRVGLGTQGAGGGAEGLGEGELVFLPRRRVVAVVEQGAGARQEIAQHGLDVGGARGAGAVSKRRGPRASVP